MINGFPLSTDGQLWEVPMSGSTDRIDADEELRVQAANNSNEAPDDLTVQQIAHLLHIVHAQEIKDKLIEEAAILRERQEKIKFAHEVMQEINNAMDKEGNLDITNNLQLKDKLKAVAELGISISEKDQRNTHESRRLLDNLTYAVEDWSREDATQMRKMQNLYTEKEQSIMIAKHTMSSLDKAIRAMISGITKG